MKRLTRRAEDLLKEILEQRDEKGNCNSDYWKKKFESLSSADDALIRSVFKELKEADMISYTWADDYPYILYVLGNGLSYFETLQQLNDEYKANQNINIFYGNTTGVQIQQESSNSTQELYMSNKLDQSKVNELIQMIKKYDSVLDEEFGRENAQEIRRVAKELSDLEENSGTNEKQKSLMSYIRDLSINAGGGLIAAGLIQLIASMIG